MTYSVYDDYIDEYYPLGIPIQWNDTMNYRQRLQKVIPAGCHTYSRGSRQFPSNAPQILSRGKGAYVYDDQGVQFLDYGMGLRSVSCGYDEDSISAAAWKGMIAGNCLSRPSMIELEAAEMLTGILGTDMVKFTKTGSAATTAAVKLARAETGRDMVACAKAPFYSYDDWFIETTSRSSGVREALNDTQIFDSARDLSHFAPSLAAIITEPYGDLQALRNLCDKHGIILIFDEMITGFRYRFGSKTDVTPDLACYGKALANGFSVACVTGKREIMELGARDDMFLLSTTHGAEMCGLSAMMATLKYMQEHNVPKYLNEYGESFCTMMTQCAQEADLGNFLITGDPVNPSYQFYDLDMPASPGGPSLYYKTLFQQELAKQGVLMPWVAFSHAHTDHELELTAHGVLKAMKTVKRDLEGERLLEGHVIEPVFHG